MLHFVLKDINPNKANQFDLFLKEMNDIAFTESVGDAPHVSADYLKEDEAGNNILNLSENGISVKFKGIKNEGNVVSGAFVLSKGKNKWVEVSYTVNETLPTAMRIKLNCAGESMLKRELERAFQRDFSNEAHLDMNKSLDELQAVKEPRVVVEEVSFDAKEEEVKRDENPISFEENEELIRSLGEDTSDAEKATFLEEEIEELEDEISEEIVLSETTLDKAKNEREIIRLLNDLSHDVTRGRISDFRDLALKTETLENGAVVQLMDEEANGYSITFRKGTLGDMFEISFFLETEDELVFSVYIASSGNGKITADGSQAKITLKKLRDQLT